MSANFISELICPACNGKFSIIYYQRRAADEPPDKVVYCSNCPLDTGRLDINKLKVIGKNSSTTIDEASTAYINKYSKLKKSKESLSFSSTLKKVDSSICIKVEGVAAQRCFKSISKLNMQSTDIVACPVQIITEHKTTASYYFFTSVLENTATTINATTKIAPYVTCEDVTIYSSESSKASKLNKYIMGEEFILDALQYCSSVVLRVTHDNQRPYISVTVCKNTIQSRGKDEATLLALEEILVEYGTELTIKSIVGSNTLNTLYTQSGRAYDYPSAPNNGYTYTWKPDGERFWYIKYGSIWLFSRRLLSGRIAGWNICTKLQPVLSIGPILDVEVMIAHPPILIDVLAMSSGVTTTASRTLNTVLTEFSFMVDSGTIDVPIHVRDYYRSERELLKTKSSVTYPIDGVVGIQDGSMTIIKLKDEKSIELQLLSNGNLVTSDKQLIATSNLEETYSVDSIVEIRFTKQARSDEPVINSTLLRTDKLKANDYEACKSILNTISDTPDSLAMRNAVQWCNSVRKKLHQIASKTTGKGRVILDIGSGDGQAVSDYSIDPDVTYILLEPNMMKCKRMKRRLEDANKGTCRLFTEASMIINAANLASTGKLKHAIVCGTLKDILQQENCIRALKSCIRYCISSFSISYTVEELQELSENNLNVIGCGYMYDSADKNGVLIHESGVLMKYTNPNNTAKNREAVVMWGSDKPYTETAIILDDFKDLFYCKLAKMVVPVVNDAKASLLNTISSKVYIISTSKYI